MFFPFLSEKKQSWRNPAYKEENHKNTLAPEFEEKHDMDKFLFIFKNIFA